MNYIWPVLIIVALVFGVVNGRLDATVAAAFSGAQGAVESVVAMAGVFCFWTGILKLAEKSGFSKILARVIRPAVRFIFPGLPAEDRAFSHISMNIVANIMGMGNAATPAGIDAMTELDRRNGYSPYASDEMCMFVVINTASLQVIPTTVMALRSAAGSASPGAVMLPVWIASAAALAASVLMMKFMIRRRKSV